MDIIQTLFFKLNSFSPDNRNLSDLKGAFSPPSTKLVLQMQENVFFIPSLNVDSSHQVVNHDSSTQLLIMHWFQRFKN